MRLGILSDSHGRHDTTARAVSALREAGAELLLHLGDVGSDRVLDELVGHPARVVFGNCDDATALARYAELVGVTVDHPRGEIDAGGRIVIFTHGDRPSLMDAALERRPAYLLHGHTHELRDERIGDVRVINPGALFRASRYTAALLDTTRDVLRIIELERS